MHRPISVLVITVPRAGDVEILRDVVLQAEPGNLENLVVRERRIVREADPVATEAGKAGRNRQRRIRIVDAFVSTGHLPWTIRVRPRQLPALVVGDGRSERIE